MKKIIILIMIAFSINSFSAQVLNNKIGSFFINKEIKNLVFGSYNLDTEVVAVSKVKGTGDDAISKADKDARTGVQNGAKDYAYEVLNGYLNSSLVSGPGFNSTKMREFASDIAKEVSSSAQRKGSWSTSKKETIVLYTIDKEAIRNSASRMFNERLGSVIQKLNDYKNNFDQGGYSQPQTIEVRE